MKNELIASIPVAGAKAMPEGWNFTNEKNG